MYNIEKNFIKYVSIPTNSNSECINVPSSEKQFKLAEELVKQLKKQNVNYNYDSEHCYVYAKLDGDKNIPGIGFISHLDTSEDANDNPMNLVVIRKYDGTDVKYNGKILLKVDEEKPLKNNIGNTLITTDGNTLLGADDKAGITEIMAMIDYFQHSNEPHGDIFVVFTPDEEIGQSIKYLDRNIFNPKYAYTVDGEYLGEISYENFYAADIKIEINGNNVHSGYAKNKMTNALLIANAINSLLPELEIPSKTDNKEGFYHLHKLDGTVAHAQMLYLIRDFEKENFYNRIKIITEIVDKLNNEYNNCIKLDTVIRYKNMKEIIEKNIEVVNLAEKAIKKVNVEPYNKPIRGGTDGTVLSFEGIPCPNLGAGGHNFHSTKEYIFLEDMEKITEILIQIVREYYLNYKLDNKTEKQFNLKK